VKAKIEKIWWDGQQDSGSSCGSGNTGSQGGSV
jgi:hypothetical protein